MSFLKRLFAMNGLVGENAESKRDPLDVKQRTKTAMVAEKKELDEKREEKRADAEQQKAEREQKRAEKEAEKEAIVEQYAAGVTAEALAAMPTAEKRYAACFANPTPVSVAANLLGISHVACLNQVYRYEKREKMKRCGTSEHYGRAILFQWVSGK